MQNSNPGRRGHYVPRSVCSSSPAGFWGKERRWNCNQPSVEWKLCGVFQRKSESLYFLSHPPLLHHSQQQRKEHDEPSGPRNLPEQGVSVPLSDEHVKVSDGHLLLCLGLCGSADINTCTFCWFVSRVTGFAAFNGQQWLFLSSF